MKEQFIQFLKDNDAYDAFKKEAGNIDTELEKRTPDLYSHSFIWSHTDDGKEYWEIIDKKWQKQLHNDK